MEWWVCFGEIRDSKKTRAKVAGYYGHKFLFSSNDDIIEF
jgi:ribosomal protein S17E